MTNQATVLRAGQKQAGAPHYEREKEWRTP